MHGATLVQHWCNTGAAISEFQPAAPLNRFVAKACAEGIRTVVVTPLAVTPLAVTAPYWTKLLHASVVPNTDGHLRIQRQLAAFSS
jgi:hypothetical protein